MFICKHKVQHETDRPGIIILIMFDGWKRELFSKRDS